MGLTTVDFNGRWGLATVDFNGRWGLATVDFNGRWGLTTVDFNPFHSVFLALISCCSRFISYKHSPEIQTDQGASGIWTGIRNDDSSNYYLYPSILLFFSAILWVKQV